MMKKFAVGLLSAAILLNSPLAFASPQLVAAAAAACTPAKLISGGKAACVAALKRLSATELSALQSSLSAGLSTAQLNALLEAIGEAQATAGLTPAGGGFTPPGPSLGGGGGPGTPS